MVTGEVRGGMLPTEGHGAIFIQGSAWTLLKGATTRFGRPCGCMTSASRNAVVFAPGIGGSHLTAISRSLPRDFALAPVLWTAGRRQILNHGNRDDEMRFS
jgi:hypothetical protein